MRSKCSSILWPLIVVACCCSTVSASIDYQYQAGSYSWRHSVSARSGSSSLQSDDSLVNISEPPPFDGRHASYGDPSMSNAHATAAFGATSISETFSGYKDSLLQSYAFEGAPNNFVRFRVTEDTDYTLSGLFSVTGVPGTATLSLYLRDMSDGSYEFRQLYSKSNLTDSLAISLGTKLEDGGIETLEGSPSGTLLSDRYYMLVWTFRSINLVSGAGGSANLSGQWALTIPSGTVVPAPPAAFLVVLGLGLVRAIHRRLK